MQTQPFGKEEPSNLLALVALIRLKSIPLAKLLRLPVILLLNNQYSLATTYYFRRIFFYMKLLVKLRKEYGENVLTDSALDFLDPITPPRVYCPNLRQHLSSLCFGCPRCRSQSIKIQCRT
jgi:hypothetical protein